MKIGVDDSLPAKEPLRLGIEICDYVLSDSKELEDLISNYGFSKEDEKTVRDNDGFMRISPSLAEVFNKYDCWTHIYCKCRLFLS